jgi:hypothetical protein
MQAEKPRVYDGMGSGHHTTGELTMDLREIPTDEDWVAQIELEFDDDELPEEDELEDWPLDEDVRRLLHDR